MRNRYFQAIFRHERWDGMGYPYGLREEEIPLDARIIALVDAFEVMVSDRPYRRGMPAARALAIIEENAGPQWDPAPVDRFLTLVATHFTAAAVAPSTPPILLQARGAAVLAGRV